MEFKKIEKKWQKKWEKARVFESNPEKRKKFFITIPYPYVNGAPHIGNGYTWFRGDAYARFKRMQGFNVLFPQGFHATGEPILGVIERLKKNDKIQIDTLKNFGAKDSDIKKFIKDPKFLVQFYMKRWIEDLKLSGVSIDWRRTFVTTTLTPTYSRFIEWQYNTLKKKGYVIQGTHPVIWCPKCQSPTGDHDRLKGEGESPIEYILIKFKLNEMFLPAATLRPETIYGVTNIWINPDASYVKIKVNDQIWIVSKKCFEKLRDQMKNIEFIDDIELNEIIGMRCENPISRKNIPILPSKFVDPDSATGIVMSVPAHAPYDWIAIKELIESNDLEKFGVEKNELEPISIIETQGFGEHPAKEICEKMKISSLKQEKELDEATKIVYKKEFHLGVLKDNCSEYSGLKVSGCKEKLSIEFIEKNVADVMWDCTNVICRCTTKCHVKILENQWFLKFSDENWKKQVRRCVSRMKIYPEEARNNINNTIDWLHDKACTRKTGLGTPLPWDKEWIIETLSDSTIYMAYYTISRIINKNKIPAKKLTDDIFDFIFLGKGDLNKISKESKINKKIIMDMKNEFEYFYPVDLRTSGKDLLQHHLIFYIFHHTAIFPEKYWPKAIAVNGYVNVEKEKMSKSKGNIISLRECLNNYGVDMTRINIICSSEEMDDANWSVENIRGYRSRYEFLFDIIKNLKRMECKNIRNIDLYLQSKMQKNITYATKNFEIMKFRSAIQYALFDCINDLKWYIKRVGLKNANRKIVKDSIKNIVKMLSPITPHLCEELWCMLGNNKFISTEQWPKPDETLINEEAELSEELIKRTINDIIEIKKLAKIKPKKISLFVAEDWKFKLYQFVLKNKNKNINEITDEIMRSDMKIYGKATVMFIQSLYKNINEIKPILSRNKQFQILNECKKFLEDETKCKIEVLDSEKSENPKAKSATPQKFGIYLE
ncbi:MAG: leucine--tRNA ligase [Candidatus Aenigmatarchaeota archaeon]